MLFQLYVCTQNILGEHVALLRTCFWLCSGISTGRLGESVVYLIRWSAIYVHGELHFYKDKTGAEAGTPKAFALQVADLSSIPSTPYGPLSITRSDLSAEPGALK